MASLFTKGSLFVYKPVLVKYIAEPAQTETPKIQAAFSVPKKKFKKAVDRNRLKRQMRNVYRLYLPTLKEQVLPLQKNLYLIFVYNQTEMLDYALIEKAMHRFFKQLDLS